MSDFLIDSMETAHYICCAANDPVTLFRADKRFRQVAARAVKSCENLRQGSLLVSPGDGSGEGE